MANAAMIDFIMIDFDGEKKNGILFFVGGPKGMESCENFPETAGANG